MTTTGVTNSTDSAGENTIDVNYVLGFIDAAVFGWAVFQLIRILIYSKKGLKNFKPKLIFHCIIAVSMLVRSGFFFALPTFNKDPVKYYRVSLIWFDLSSILIFAGYGCLLLFWMELYSRFSKPYSTSKDFWSKWTPYIVVFSVILGAAIVAWVVLLLFWAQKPLQMIFLDYISEGTISGLFLAAGFGFLCFGILLFLSFKKLNSLSSQLHHGGGNGHKLALQKRPPPPEAIRAAVVGSICTVCFCLRSIITLISVRKQMKMDATGRDSSIITTKFNLDWELELIYFFITEILPTILMMFRLRKMKKQKSKPLLINDNIQDYSSFTSPNNTFIKNIPKITMINNNNNGNSSLSSSFSPSPLISSLQNSQSFTHYGSLNNSHINNHNNSNTTTSSPQSLNSTNQQQFSQQSQQSSFVNSPIISYQNPNIIPPN